METMAVKYTMGPISAGIQVTDIDLEAANSGQNGDSEMTVIGVAFAVNENLSVSYGEREVEHSKTGGTAHVTEDGEGLAVAYTMGSMKIAGNRNEVSNNNNSSADSAKDEMTEIAVSFAF